MPVNIGHKYECASPEMSTHSLLKQNMRFLRGANSSTVVEDSEMQLQLNQRPAAVLRPSHGEKANQRPLSAGAIMTNFRYAASP